MTSLYKATLPSNPEFEEYILFSGSTVFSYESLEDIPNFDYVAKCTNPSILKASHKHKIAYITEFTAVENLSISLVVEAKTIEDLLQDNPELFI
jgi:hypothetical protein